VGRENPAVAGLNVVGKERFLGLFKSPKQIQSWNPNPFIIFNNIAILVLLVQT
jgi:hypothetical protein